MRQLRSAGYTRGTAVAAGSMGEPYLVGFTRGALPDATLSGPTDVFVARG